VNLEPAADHVPNPRITKKFRCQCGDQIGIVDSYSPAAVSWPLKGSCMNRFCARCGTRLVQWAEDAEKQARGKRRSRMVRFAEGFPSSSNSGTITSD
jgi:hypothetical protein